MIYLTPQDQDLVTFAKEEAKKLKPLKKHNLVTLIRTKQGKIITGFNLQGSFGCVDICAEPITLGKALSEGDSDIKTIVSVIRPKEKNVNQEIKVASPCGKCRELLIDYVPEAFIILRDGDRVFKIKAKDLIPHRYSKN